MATASPVSGSIQEWTPLIQAALQVFSSLTAAFIGAYVATRATRTSVRAQADRDDAQRNEQRNAAKGEFVRGKAERFLALLVDQLESERREFSVALSVLQAWAAGRPGPQREEPAAGRLLAELKVMETLYFPELSGTYEEILTASWKCAVWRRDELASAAQDLAAYREKVLPTYGERHIEPLAELRAATDQAIKRMADHVAVHLP